MGLRSSPENGNNAPQTCGGNSINQLRCATKRLKSHWRWCLLHWFFVFFFFLFCVEVDNMMSFTRNYIWEIFVFLFGAFTSSVFKDQHKTPIYFLSWKMLSAMCWAFPRKSSPPPSQQASSVWLQKGIYLGHLPSGFKPHQLFTSPEHTKPHSPKRTLGSPGCMSMTVFLSLLHFGKLQRTRSINSQV